MQHFLQDLKQALRLFRQSPSFTLTAVVALTLGIGVNTAIFSVVNTVLLKPLPFSDADTLVAVENTTHGRAYGPWTSPVKFMYWRAQTDVFSDVAAIDSYPRYLNYSGGDAPERITASRVSESYFRVLGAPIIRGRPFTAEEDRPGGPKVVVISYEFWQQRLGGAEEVLGKSLMLSGSPSTIVGILDQTFSNNPYFGAASSGDNADVLVPFQLDPNTTIEANSFVNIARLNRDVTLAEAQAHVAASAAAFRQRFPTSLPPGDGFTVLEARHAMTIMFGDPHTRLWVLLGAVGFVLLIACANVTNLLLVRATGRAREIAIRSALGAGRGRIARGLLTESLLLSLAGGLGGLVAGFLGIRALLAVNTAGLPRLGSDGSLLSMDWRVVTFTLGLSLATGLVFGLVPALVGSQADLNTIIKSSGSRSSGGFGQNKTRGVLVTAEIGLAMVLLVGAALLIRTSIALGRIDPGFDPSHVLTMHMILSDSQFRTQQSIEPIVRAGLEEARSIPDVTHAAVTGCLPLQCGQGGLPFAVVGRPNGQAPASGSAKHVASSEGYFAALGIPVIRGRAFTARDNQSGAPVAIINEAMAKRFWTNGLDPLQDRLVVGVGIKELAGGPERRIVGVVGDVRYDGLDQNPEPTMYVPMSQVADPVYALFVSTGAPLSWIVRTRRDSAALGKLIRNSIRKTTGLPVVDVEPLERVVSTSVSYQRMNMLLMSVFGGGALLLAAIGIYGVMAYSVQQRTQEIGIRLALGADAAGMKRDMIRQGTALIGFGLATGFAAAFLAAKVLSSFLFGVEVHDPAVFITVPVVVASIALVSVWLPARNASKVDPLEALRYE